MADVGMDNGGTRPNGYVSKLDDIRDPVRRDPYLRVGRHRKVGQRIGERQTTGAAVER